MNKKGDLGDSTMSFAFFAIIFLVAAGISLGLFLFFGEGYDSRSNTALSLLYLTEKCVREKEVFTQNFDFFKECNINHFQENNLIYIKSGEKEFSAGVNDFKTQCFLEGAKENRYYPRCIVKNIESHGEKFEIIVGSNQEIE